MTRALGISLVLHAACLFLLSDLGADSSAALPVEEMVTLDVEILTEAEFVSTTSPVPVSHDIAILSAEDLQQVVIPVTANAIALPDTEVRMQHLLTSDPEIPERPEIRDAVLPVMDMPAAIELAQVPDRTEAFAFGVESGVVEEARLAATLDLKLVETLQLPEAPRVALAIRPESPPDAVSDDVAREAARADPEADADPVESNDVATAPEQSTLKIVTEAEKAEEATTQVALETHSERLSMLLSQGIPLTRPSATVSDASVINEAILEDVIEQQIAAATSVPPPVTMPSPQLTIAEIKKSIKSAVTEEWNIGVLSSDAKRISVTIHIQFDQEGRVMTLEMIDASGGDGNAVQKAYDTAKRAINKAFENGVDWPPEEYDKWGNVELTFDPKDMRRL